MDLVELTNPAAFKRRKVKAVTFDGSIAYIRVMSGRDRAAWAAFIRENTDRTEGDVSEIYNRLLALTLCDPDGNRLFASPDEVADTVDAKAMEPLFEAALAFNKLDVDAEKKG
jgi:hypothetical protein